MPTEQRKARRIKEIRKAGLAARETEKKLQEALNKLSALQTELEEIATAKAELHGEIAQRETKWYRREREHEDVMRTFKEEQAFFRFTLEQAHEEEVSALKKKVSALETEIQVEGVRSLRRRLRAKSEELDLANRKMRGYERRIKMMLNEGF